MRLIDSFSSGSTTTSQPKLITAKTSSKVDLFSLPSAFCGPLEDCEVGCILALDMNGCINCHCSTVSEQPTTPTATKSSATKSPATKSVATNSAATKSAAMTTDAVSVEPETDETETREQQNTYIIRNTNGDIIRDRKNNNLLLTKCMTNLHNFPLVWCP